MREIFDLINGMAPYLLLGFFLAGLMHAFVPGSLYRRYVGGSSFRSVINAAMLGIPLPLCSCGVIPTAMSLRKEGASRGATVSFLIATPQTGVDSIMATYSLMGLPFALTRPIAALTTSLIGGCLVNRLESEDGASIPEENAGDGCCREGKGFIAKIRLALRYAFLDMMQDIGRWLVSGLIVAGLITAFVPASFFASFADKPLLSMLLVLLFSIPMYLCATGSIPIAVALMLKGLSPGTALVLLMAGPAVNVASMLVIGKVMGKRSLALYLLSIVSGAIIFGLGIDYLLPREWFTAPLEHIQTHGGGGISYFKLACTILFTILLINALIRRYLSPSTAATCSCQSCSKESDDLAEREEAAPEVWEITVKGMSCNHCKGNVEKAILGVDGVVSVDITLAGGQAIIQGHFDHDAVVKAITALGFEVIVA